MAILMRLLAALLLAAAARAEAEEFRVEKDTLGEVKVPKARKWGAQTQRSVENFRIGVPERERLDVDLLEGLVLVKLSAARANARLGEISKAHGDAIAKAAEKVLDQDTGLLRSEFPLVNWQTGSGTQSNMNANEVLASLANEDLGSSEKKVLPNDHVNRGQSTNDGFPTAIHIAAVIGVHRRLLPALQLLRRAFSAKAKEFASVIKTGRTHLQDAVPMTAGQELSAFEAQIDYAIARVSSSEGGVMSRLLLLSQGGTAVGTGVNAVEGFAEAFCEEITKVAAIDGVVFKVNPNKFEGIAAHDALAELAGVQSTIATSLMKIANDFKLLSSGPSTGLSEYILPSNEPGSSIMPGKVNPTQAEALSMVAAQVMGNSFAVQVANSHGTLQLNTFKPVIGDNIVRSTRLMADAVASFSTNCVEGLQLNREKIDSDLGKNAMLATSLNPVVGYAKAAEVVKRALKERKTLKEVAVTDMKAVDGETFDRIVSAEKMLGPNPRKEEL